MENIENDDNIENIKVFLLTIFNCGDKATPVTQGP